MKGMDILEHGWTRSVAKCVLGVFVFSLMLIAVGAITNWSPHEMRRAAYIVLVLMFAFFVARDVWRSSGRFLMSLAVFGVVLLAGVFAGQILRLL